MDMLSILFGSEARVKIMRLFLFNPETSFDTVMIAQKSKVNSSAVKKEVSVLEKAGLIKKRVFYKILEKKVRGKMVEKKLKAKGYCLNIHFHYLSALKHLLINTKTLDGEVLVKRLAKAGKLNLVLVAGVFTQDKDSRVDMLIVGNNINKAALTNTIKAIEAELGKELMYAYFETPDFQYRLGMYDKLIRDILDYPHQILLNKINLQ